MLFEGKLSDYEEGDYDTIRPSDYASVGSVKHVSFDTSEKLHWLPTEKYLTFAKKAM